MCDVEPCDYGIRHLLNAERLGSGGAAERQRPKEDELADRIREYLADGQWHPSLQPVLMSEGKAAGTIQRALKKATGVKPRSKPGMGGGGNGSSARVRMRQTNRLNCPTRQSRWRVGDFGSRLLISLESWRVPELTAFFNSSRTLQLSIEFDER